MAETTMDNHSSEVKAPATAETTKINIPPIIQPRRHVTCFSNFPIGDAKRTTLRGNTDLESASQSILMDYGEVNLNCQILISQKVLIKKGPKNPTCASQFELLAGIPLRSISNYVFNHIKDKAELPESVQKVLPEDWSPALGISLITFESSHVFLSDVSIPPTQSAKAGEMMASFIDCVRQSKNAKATHQFCILVRTRTDNDWNMFFRLESAWRKSSSLDPIFRWIRSCPEKHQLHIGKILAPADRPPLSVEGLVISPKFYWQSPLEYKIHLVYAYNNEHLCSVASQVAWEGCSLLSSFAAISHSDSIMDNENDNSLHKMYSCTTQLPANFTGDFPEPGDFIDMVLVSFEIPDCPLPEEEDLLSAQQEAEELERERDYERQQDAESTNDWHHPRKSPSEMREERQALDDEYNAELAKIWRGHVVSIFDGKITVIITRPSDPRWKGRKSTQPRVNTIIPVHDHNRFPFISRYLEELPILREHRVILRPVCSSQTYRDTIGGINRFFDTKYEPNELLSRVSAHLSEVLITRDLDTPFTPVDLFQDCMASDWNEFTTTMSPRQLAAFKDIRYEHGLVVIPGCVASGKTRCAVTLSVCILNREEASNKVLAVSETNVNVDSLAREFVEVLRHPDPAKQKDRVVLRLLAVRGEKEQLKEKVAPLIHKVNYTIDPETAAEFLSETDKMLCQMAEAAEARRKAGDKRRTPAIFNLTLSEAMWHTLNEGIAEGDNLCESLKSMLDTLVDNPDDPTFNTKGLNELMSHLCSSTIRKADVIVSTMSLAIHPSIIKMLSRQITWCLIEEGGKVGSGPFVSLVAAYNNARGFIIDGDAAQQTTYAKSHLNPKFPNPFSFVLKESALEIGMHLSPNHIMLREGFRSYTHNFNAFISAYWYREMMIDGNFYKRKPPQWKFCHDFLKNNLGVRSDDNFLVFHMESHSHRQNHSGSSENLTHRLVALSIIKRLLADLDGVPPSEFDKQQFQIEYLNQRVNANGFKKVQGISRDVTIVDMTLGGKLTAFSDDSRDLLVNSTRHKHMIIFLTSTEAANPSSYGDKSSAVFMKGAGKNWCSITEFAKANGSRVDI
ncbi:hypothetical protein BOTCAL_0261g00120 [Botryotinia calthae]|uniref:DNA2/NAM7 helicase helicase domain-containing protein n=1 Tax=Botryotinia calthae TaxID=38488 RepID=A0A4Y8CW50_9HELO|nr:hypothetical protein BOTCAL_0261g00120 [Botryotinia calthae]